jgi:hypothetical protein
MLLIACAALMASACTATVRGRANTGEPPPPEPVVRDHREPPPPVVRDHRTPRWDSRGWVLLGEQRVNGGADRDTIRVGGRAGVYTQLMLVVEDSDLRLDDIIIQYDNGRKHSPRVQHEFREGSRTRAIDLRGEARVIRDIELRYGNVPGGGRATVQVWGRDTGGEVSRAPSTPPPPVVRDHRDREPDYPTRGGWSTRGWTMLGEQWVSGKSDFIRVGAREGTFTKLMMVVEDGDLQLNDIIIEYDNGRKHSPRVAHFFKEGQRTQAIDLRGDARVIKRIELRYANVGAGRRAKVSIWGRAGG